VTKLERGGTIGVGGIQEKRLGGCQCHCVPGTKGFANPLINKKRLLIIILK
jgi:hypothetical protein